MSIFSENLARIVDRIRAAETSAGRPAGSVRLVAVTKTLGPERVAEAIAAGIDAIGENRVQEAFVKRPLAEEMAKGAGRAGSGRAVEWHLIGHLQTNKVARAVATFDVVQSVDSERLAREIDAKASRDGRRVPILLEANVSGESAKTGVAPGQFLELAERARALAGLDVRGAMALGPMTDDASAIRAAFARLRGLAESAVSRGLIAPHDGRVEISIGMSDDFEAAILEGSTMVRIGRALFGAR